ncbi:MAG: CAP domain-containing protein [Candidatus Magnetominusculus sp. LBB02]|nr:CAP domain-containing protein [Candidatus Magnetominusculus sp. LBB02]
MRKWLLIVLFASLVFVYVRHNHAPQRPEPEEDSAVESQPQSDVSRQSAIEFSAAMLGNVRRRQLELINKSRSENGLAPVSLDDTASMAAQRHCEAMAAGDFFGHIGLSGSLPFHRYNLDEGGYGHVAENVCLFKSSAVISSDEKNITELSAKGHGMFMAEVAPDDGHRRTILDRRHNYVGLGVFLKGGSFTYCEEFLDKYIEITGPPQKTIPAVGKVNITGKVINPGQYGLYMVSVTYDAALIPPPNPKLQPSSYKDAGTEKAAIAPPWDFNKDGSRYDRGSGEFSISIKTERKGYYYIVFYLREDQASIPYTGGHARVSTDDGFIGGAQVIRIN